MKSDNLKKYAGLVVKIGLNLKKDQLLVVRGPIECAPFIRAVMSEAYAAGASDVEIQWQDEHASKIKYMEAPDSALNTVAPWLKQFYEDADAKGAAFLAISASDPELMKDVPPERMMMAQKASGEALKAHRQKLMGNELPWCVVSVPTEAWAKKVFPELPVEDAIAELWDAIFKTTRVDQDDPIAAWEAHKAHLKERMNKLNDLAFESLHYENNLGTDLTIGLPEGHIWLGGADETVDGHEFVANMPTEEIFTAPDFRKVEGVVYSAMPLNLNGTLIEDFKLTFKAGKIVDVSARSGEEKLKKFIETDEGASYLGEVALVPYDSPISNMNILFYNTLYDENASCHLAIGKAYPVCISGGNDLDEAGLKANGINESIVHEDFMIGTSDLKITGKTKDGTLIVIFENGNFAL